MIVAAWKIGVVVAAAGTLVAERFVGRRRATTAVLGVVAAAAVVGYFELGRFPRGFVHHWDMYHYYMGSKYFDQVGYDGLYDATAAAMLDSPDFQARKSLRPEQPVRNLRDDTLETAADAYRRGLAVERRFSEEEWRRFHLELAFWGPYPEFWAGVLQDHGYNPSPVAHRFYSWMTSAMYERNPNRMWYLALADPLLLALSFGLIAWAFGLRTALLSVIFFGVDYATPFAWTGGAFIRQDWLFFLTAAVCCYRRGYSGLAGGLFAAATLWRLFPALFVVGLVVVGVRDCVRARVFLPRYRRLVVGGAVGTALLVGASMTTAWGPGIWRDFSHRMSLHSKTPAVNNVGMKIAVTYPVGDNTHRARRQWERTRDSEHTPAEIWREGRRDVYRRWRVPVLALSALFGIAWLWVLWRRGDELAGMVLGAALVTWWLMTSNYYFTFVLLLPLLVDPKRPLLALPLLALISYPYLLIGSDDWLFWHASIGWSLLSVLLLVMVRLGYARPRG